jgi:hypothetical protein
MGGVISGLWQAPFNFIKKLMLFPKLCPRAPLASGFFLWLSISEKN